MAESARQTALRVLERCRRDRAFSDTLLTGEVTKAGLDGRDAALAARLCYGVLQNELLCDFYIDHFAADPTKLEPKVRDILRLSVYQILFMDKIPAHAAVSEGVELCKKTGFARASGLVNAVLRKIADSRDRLPEIPRGDECMYLSTKYSVPKELTALFLREFGAETEVFLSTSNAPAPTVIQTNTLKTTPDALREALAARGANPKGNPLVPGCFEISGAGDLRKLPEFLDGLFYVQDAAAALAVRAAGPQPGMTVLDACAAPGGKSFAAAIAAGDRASIFSRDIHEKKLRLIDSGAKRLGITSVHTAAMDAKRPEASLLNACDVVLADAPCSGFGVLRKKPDIRFRELSALEALPEVQLAILNGLAPCVRPGGVLLYSTCTVLKRENDDVAAAFLSAHPDFQTEAFELPAPIGAVESGCLTLLPNRHGTDGFYICKLRKKHD
ncbi:MAG: 16S rRNA (cytosine(967)-C(5))-methyltransferase RsmB [Oscillospiraceae bacterium]|jgi:16S rRNA (cytosine967-C5)-methyltransferase